MEWYIAHGHSFDRVAAGTVSLLIVSRLRRKISVTCLANLLLVNSILCVEKYLQTFFHCTSPGRLLAILEGLWSWERFNVLRSLVCAIGFHEWLGTAI